MHCSQFPFSLPQSKSLHLPWPEHEAGYKPISVESLRNSDSCCLLQDSLCNHPGLLCCSRVPEAVLSRSAPSYFFQNHFHLLLPVSIQSGFCNFSPFTYGAGEQMVYSVALLVAPQLSPLITLFYKLNGMLSFSFQVLIPLLLKVWSSDEQPQGHLGVG